LIGGCSPFELGTVNPKSSASRRQSPAATPISITETGHDSLTLVASELLMLTISTTPMFVILPATWDIEGTAYNWKDIKCSVSH
jgi:hypothetical protein